MLDIIKGYFKSKKYAQQTLKEAIAKEQNISPDWIETYHDDFDKSLINIMAEKVANWNSQGVNTSDMKISDIVLEFKSYESLYKIKEPKEVTDMKSRLAMVSKFYKILGECPDEYELKSPLVESFDQLMIDMQKQIDDASS